MGDVCLLKRPLCLLKSGISTYIFALVSFAWSSASTIRKILMEKGCFKITQLSLGRRNIFAVLSNISIKVMAKHCHSTIVLTYNPNSICRLAMNTNVYQRLPFCGTPQKPSQSCYARAGNLFFSSSFHPSIKRRFGWNNKKAHHRINL